MGDEIPATLESPPNPPSDNGDMLDRSPDRLVEAKIKAKRVMSEKQLQNLRKGREPRAAKGKAKIEPRETEPAAPDQTPPEPPSPEPKAKPKPKPMTKPQPKPQAQDQYVTPNYVPSVKFSVF